MKETPDPQDKTNKLERKLELVKEMQSGAPWQEAAQTAGLTVSRATSYRYLNAFQNFGETALQDGRMGHPAKVKPEVQDWLVQFCKRDQQISSSQLQPALKERFGITVSVSRLNEVRAALGIARQPSRGDLKKT